MGLRLLMSCRLTWALQHEDVPSRPGGLRAWVFTIQAGNGVFVAHRWRILPRTSPEAGDRQSQLPVACHNLASGQSATIRLVTQVDQQFSGTITNTASVTGNETESNTNNNTASQPTVINDLLSSIAGSVYVDSDNDGQKDTGEAPISGVVIVLAGTDSQGTAVQLQATTGADGAFSFANLRRGTYKLTQQQPVNYRDGKDTAGSLSANATVNDEFSNIQLPAGTAAVDYLFGERSVTFSKRRFLSSAQSTAAASHRHSACEKSPFWTPRYCISSSARLGYRRGERPA